MHTLGNYYCCQGHPELLQFVGVQSSQPVRQIVLNPSMISGIYSGGIRHNTLHLSNAFDSSFGGGQASLLPIMFSVIKKLLIAPDPEIIVKRLSARMQARAATINDFVFIIHIFNL